MAAFQEDTEDEIAMSVLWVQVTGTEGHVAQWSPEHPLPPKPLPKSIWV